MFLQVVIYSFGIAYRQRTLLLRTQDEKLQAQHTHAEMLRMKDLDEVKARFYANISHEFRTPLSLISGPLTLAKKANRHEDGQVTISTRTFDIIDRNTKRLQNLIDQLLELSKIDSGKIHLNLIQGDLIKFIKSIAFSFESMSEGKGISFNTSLPKELNNAFFDKDKLEKILSNLLSNAFKYTPDGGTVTLIVDHTDNHYIIEISDTGEGLNKEEVKRIFERFYRAEGTEEKGSGIGLALTKEMVDLQNGRINVSSRKGEGTIFKVKIPFVLNLLPKLISIVSEKSDVQHMNGKIAELNVLNTEKSHGLGHLTSINNKNIPVVLLVEDNADLRQYISEVLKDSLQSNPC